MAREIAPGNGKLRAVLAVFLAMSLLGADQAAPPPAAIRSAPVRDPDHFIRGYVMSWKDLRNQYVVMQQRDYSCGAAALATLLRYYWGDNVDELAVLTEIEKMLTKDELKDRVQNGLSITDLRRVAVRMGYQATIGTLKLEQIKEAKIPVIVAIKPNDLNHFVVIRGFYGDWVYLADPIRGKIRIPTVKFADQWIENALLVVAPRGKTQSTVSKLGLRPGELDPYQLNRQLVRTRPEKTFLR